MNQVYMTKKILGFRRPVFPRPEFVSRLISQNENWAKDNLTNISIHEEKKPLQFQKVVVVLLVIIVVSTASVVLVAVVVVVVVHL